jgi:hypothetical protein
MIIALALAAALLIGVGLVLQQHVAEQVPNAYFLRLRLITRGVLAVATTWPAYALAAASLLAVWLMESAFNAAPLHASLPAITAAEPVVGIFLGVLVFGDVIRVSPGTLALQAAGIVALVAGVILVARAPVLSGLRHGRPAWAGDPGRHGGPPDQADPGDSAPAAQPGAKPHG